MMKLLSYLFLLLTLTGCGYNAMHPCCRIRPGGFERKNSINLNLGVIKKSVAVYQTEKYLIYLDRGTASQFLLSHNLLDESTISTLKSSDTIVVSRIVDQKNFLKKFISSEIDKGRALVLYKEDKAPIERIERRVYNIRRPRFGAGGKEYRDAKNGNLILQAYWSWMA